MLLSALNAIRDAGLTVRERDIEASPADGELGTVIDVTAGELSGTFVVEQKGRTPYPNEIPRLSLRREALTRHGRPLLVVPFVPEPVGQAFTRAGWSWADAQGNFDLRAPGLLLAQRRTTTPPRAAKKLLPRGSGGFAIIRALIRSGPINGLEHRATDLAIRGGVTQPRASQVLRQLETLGLVERSRGGRWRADRVALLDRFLAEYPGPGGSEHYLYGLESPTDVAVAASRASGHPMVVSADVGPDLVLAWRRPSVVILYTKNNMPSDDLGLVAARGQHDANVILRIPDDRSVLPHPAWTARVRDADVALADPVQMIWDLQHLGGADRFEAAGRLREWLLSR